MKVKELIERLQFMDPELPVPYTWTETSGCCNSTCSDTVYEDVEDVGTDTRVNTVYAEGPRGGKKALRNVQEAVVNLSS